MEQNEFQKLLEKAESMTPEQKVNFCRAMDVVPLSYSKSVRDKGEKNGYSKKAMLASTVALEGPFYGVISGLTKAINSIEFVQKGYMKNRFRITDPKLAALVDPQTMQETGLIFELNKVLEAFNKDLAAASEEARTDYAKKQDDRRNNSGKRSTKPKAQADQKKQGEKTPKAKKKRPKRLPPSRRIRPRTRATTPSPRANPKRWMRPKQRRRSSAPSRN